MALTSISTASRRTVVAAAFAAATVTVSGAAWATPDGRTGPSRSERPYLVPHVPGVGFTSILTAPDAVNGYRMAGTPDGLGAFDNGNGTYTLLMNHEFTPAEGVVRAHGGTGSFVSKYVIQKGSQRVLGGEDLIRTLVTTGSPNLNRLCSADLPEKSAFYNPRTRNGYDGRIFLNGEESAPTGRALGNVVETGTSYELAALGKAGWENLAANPSTGDKTTVVGQSDGGTQNVYVYSGTKQRTGTPVERAGLSNGTSSAILVPTMPVEDGGLPTPDGPQAFSLAAAGSGTKFDRPEDGSWDPQHPNDYYFNTTASATTHTRLWKATFEDAADPSAGGTLTKVFEGPLDPTGSDQGLGPKMLDNLTVDHGVVTLLEDVGNNAYLGGVYQLDLRSGNIRRIADHDPQRFLPGGSAFDTVDEESSGVIPAPFLGEGKYLIVVQDHKAYPDPEIVEKGQLLLMSTPSGGGAGDDHSREGHRDRGDRGDRGDRD